MKNLYRCEICKDFPCECSTDFDFWEPDGCIFGGGIPRWEKIGVNMTPPSHTLSIFSRSPLGGVKRVGGHVSRSVSLPCSSSPSDEKPCFSSPGCGPGVA